MTPLIATYKNDIDDVVTISPHVKKLFPFYIYCFTCSRFSFLSDIEDGTYIRCPKCNSPSVHSCWWVLHHHNECFWKHNERNVTIQSFSIYHEKCDQCKHKFFCWTNRCEIDWEYEVLKNKGWDILPRGIQAKSVLNLLDSRTRMH